MNDLDRTVTDILESLQKQLGKIQAAPDTSQTDFAIANAMAVLVDVLLHERRNRTGAVLS